MTFRNEFPGYHSNQVHYRDKIDSGTFIVASRYCYLKETMVCCYLVQTRLAMFGSFISHFSFTFFFSNVVILFKDFVQICRRSSASMGLYVHLSLFSVMILDLKCMNVCIDMYLRIPWQSQTSHIDYRIKHVCQASYMKRSPRAYTCLKHYR